ncbi:hypothetical protein [Acinetobacter sp. Tol 5]|uniref:hypothetical protein n=1 Tax=Acinetobacter sp. (strain Tol 5) TaxID=710648 RepID=UPI001C7733C7|nr:hypothetical protein [Acinetobacter sp. Tol 5]BCX75309.1 hypothetical protein TOL5_35090 [Acinetobacter sp. Tol 5]
MNDLPTKIQNAFSQQHVNNGKTQSNIDSINRLLASTENFEHLIEKLKHWQDDPSLSIQNYTFWLFICVGIGVAILAFFTHPILFLFAIASIAFAFYKRTSTKPLNQLIDYLQQKNLEAKYQIRFFPNETDNKIISPYDFPLFGLGDYENSIRNTIYGTWQINGFIYPYMLFNYHYVDEVETRDSDGKTKTEYRHYDLWGIIVENFPTQGISISSKQNRACRFGTKWSSGDIRFDNQYQLSGTNEMRLAKFFSPNHVLMLDQAMSNFKGDFYIHPQHPALCWLFKIDITKPHLPVNQVQTVHDLAAQLESMSMPDYEQLKQSLITILQEVQPNTETNKF